MKLIFKKGLIFCFLLVGQESKSREVILIENMGTEEIGKILETILIKKFNLPRELISLRNKSLHCSVNKDAIIHLCLSANGELEVRKINQYVVKNSLGVFLNQHEEEKL